MKTRILLIATILSLCSSVARANDLEDSIEAYNKGNYAQALELLCPLAEEGIANAQNNLGVMYVKGKGVTQDYVRARMWFNFAAKLGQMI